MATTAREPRRVRRARRSAAFHQARAQRASTAVQRYQAAADALVSAAAHTKGAKEARELRDQVAEHVHKAMEQAGISGARRELYLAKLAESGSEVQRLGRVLMCLRGAINHLSDTERDRLFDHYTRHFEAETGRIQQQGGVR